MLVSQDVLFIHPPKTGGLSVTQFLINNLPGEIIITVPEGHHSPSDKVRVMRGQRHENLPQAEKWLKVLGRKLSDFKAIVAVIRNPYEIEVSQFYYLRLGYPHDQGPGQEIALSGDFDRFCREVPYPHFGARPIESWYTVNGASPSNLVLIRAENLVREMTDAIAQVCPIKKPMPHLNATQHKDWREYVNSVNEPLIYAKYKWLYQFYERFRPGESGAHADGAT